MGADRGIGYGLEWHVIIWIQTQGTKEPQISAFFAEAYKYPSEPKKWLRGANKGKYGAFLGGCKVMERYDFSVKSVKG